MVASACHIGSLFFNMPQSNRLCLGLTYNFNYNHTMPLRILKSATVTALFSVTIFATSACRKSQREIQKQEEASSSSEFAPALVAPELMSNQIASLPGAIYKSQAQSPIHWQPWTKETLDRAKAANRLVMAVIALPQYPEFRNITAVLAKDPAIVAAINDKYVPVLIDGDAARELGLVTVDLCGEIKCAMQLPLFVWMTSDANPVAWITMAGSSSSVLGLFNQSDTMVSKMWNDDPNYVLSNSSKDNANRNQRFSLRRNTKVMSDKPAQDALASLRQLASLYDPISRSFDEAGGLLPCGTLELMSTMAIHPGISEDVRSRCLQMTRELMKDLIHGPMFDTLDGGVFSSRRSKSWSFPVFSRDCVTQARASVALLNCYRATGDRFALDKALGAIAFAEKNFQTSDGLFAVGNATQQDPRNWFWTVEDIQKELGPKDAAWWIKATKMSALGNLPPEADPSREFRNLNCLGLAMSPSEIAASESQSLSEFAPRFEAARQKLLKARNSRIGETVRDDSAYASSSFLMVSAYAAAFSNTGDEAYRKKAITLMAKCSEGFRDGPKLRSFTQTVPNSIGASRAFVYGLALQAALDLSVIDPEKRWTDWSEDLATTSAELFTDVEFLKECPDDAKLLNLPITDLAMIFGESTAGLFSQAECRLAERGRPLVESFSKLATPLPSYALQQPILHTDLLLGTLAREFKVTIVSGANLSPELELAAQRLPLRIFQYRSAKPEDKVPDGSVMVIFGNGQRQAVSTKEALQQAVLPLSEKP
jgi:uncharacterized protein YyaL (SSP411 family)